jgi:hypothetical protein
MAIKHVNKRLPSPKTSVQKVEKRTKNKGRRSNREEGRREGTILTLQENLFDLLNACFGFLDRKTLASINSIHDIRALQFLFKKGLLLFKSTEALRNTIIAQAAAAKSNGQRKTTHVR